MANNNRERQNERRRQEMERRRAAAEEQQKALAKKKKRTAIIIVASILSAVMIACAIAIPVAMVKAKEYTPVDFKALKVPTTKSEATQLVNYNNKKVVMEGYTFACTSVYYVLCKKKVETCPYVTGSVPSDGVRMSYADKHEFVNLPSNRRIRVKGTLHVNTLQVEEFEGLETWMYFIVDSYELL